MNGFWRVLADLVIVLHYGFLLYLVVGGFLAVRRPRTIWLHALAAIWGSLIIITRVPCPLTAAQNYFREQDGLPPLRAGFIQLYVRGTIYPARLEVAVQILVALIVAMSWIRFARRRRAAFPAARHSADHASSAGS